MKMKILILSLFILLISSFVFADTIPSGGVEYWNLTNLTGKWAGIVGTNNGAASSASFPSFAISGSSSPNSYNFTPPDYLDLTNNAKLDLTTSAMALSVWIKADVVSGTYNILSFPNVEASGSSKYRIFLDSGNLLKASVSTSVHQVISQTAFSDTASWHHIFFDYNGSHQRLYLDNVLVDTDAQTGTINATFNGHLWVGRFGSSFAQNFSGLIDEIKIFNRSLNTTERNQVHNFGKINITPTSFKITAKNLWNSSSILIFNSLITGNFYNDNQSVFDLSNNSNDGTRQGGQTGINFNGTQYVKILDNNIFSPFINNNLTTFSVWFNITDNIGGEGGNGRKYIFAKGKTNNFEYDLERTNIADGSRILFAIYPLDGSSSTSMSLLTGYSLNTNYNVYIVFNGTTILGYVNAVFVNSMSNDKLTGDGTANFNLGTRASTVGSGTFNGSIYRINIWNKSLTPTEIATDYNLGKDNQTTVTSGLVAEYLLGNLTKTINYSTTNGTIIPPLLYNNSHLWNITTQSSNYFSNTTLNLNISTNFLTYLFQSIINFTCFEKISNNSLTCLNSTIYPNFGSYNFVIGVNGYYNVTQAETVTALQNNTLNFTNFFSTNLTINSSSVNGDVTTCSYTTTNSTLGFTEVTAGTPVGTIGLINGSYNITADCVGFATNISVVTINTNPQSFNFTLFTTNSINFSFFDEDFPTTQLNNTNVTFELFNSMAQNYSTTTGYNFVANLTVGDYEIRYSGTGFEDIRSYFFTITNKSTQSISLYLANSSKTTSYIIRVADLSDTDVTNATVRLQRQYVEFNGQYVTIEEGKTDLDGETDFFIQESSGISYRFIVLIGGAIVKTTDPQFIINNAGISLKRITIRVDVGTSIFSTYDDIIGLFTSLTNVSTVYTYNFVDGQNQISSGCLRVTKQKFGSGTVNTVSNQCFVGTSGTLVVNISSFIQNNTIISILGLVTYNTGLEVVRERIDLSNLVKGNNSDNSDDILLTAFFFLVINLAIILIPSVIAQIFLSFLALYFLSWVGFNNLGTITAIMILVINLMINWSRKNTKDGEVK